MLAYLLYFSTSASKIKLVEPKDTSKYAFDIVYDKDGKTISTTNGVGYRVAFRKYNGNTPGAWQYLTKNSKGDQVTYTLNYQTNTDEHQDGSLDVEIGVGHIGTASPFTYDLGVYCDAYYDTGDNVQLLKRKNGDAVTFKSTDALMSILLKGNNFQTRDPNDNGDVSTIYTGVAAANDNQMTEFMLKNEFPDSTSSTTDSALAFSWTKRQSLTGRVKLQGFKVVIGQNFNIAPTIRDLLGHRTDADDPFDLSFEVKELEAQKVSVYIKRIINDVEQDPVLCGNFTSDGNTKTTGTVTCRMNFNQPENEFTYIATAIDETGLSASTSVSVQVVRKGSKPPFFYTLNDESWKPEYYATDGGIYLEYSITDEYEVSLYAQWDDKPAEKLDTIDTSSFTRVQTFQLMLSFPNDLQLDHTHRLRMWAVDNLNIKSIGNLDYTFLYSRANQPQVIEAYLSDEKVEYNKATKIVVYGELTDPNDGDPVRVFVQLEGEQQGTEIGTYTVVNQKIPFAAFYHFPAKPVARYQVTIYAIDKENHTSTQNITLPIIVWNPDAEQTPELIGKIIDSSSDLSASSNALFNLKYQDPSDQFSRQMTFNNEGFFCKFRTYNDTTGSSGLGEYYYKKSDAASQHTKDDFSVKKKIVQDKDSEFLLVKIEVQNNRYFPRRFDLSLFADSDLSGDDNGSVHQRTDGRGIVVTSEKYKLRYTMFTQDYLDFPPATIKYVTNNLHRTGTGEIPLNDIPFFNTSKPASPSDNGNSAYGVSWVNQIIPGEESITFVLVFAAYDKVKTPPRLIDLTEWKDSYDPSENAQFRINIRDFDKGEALKITIQENMKTWEDSWTVRDDNQILSKKLNFSSDFKYYRVSVQVREKNSATAFPSNTIKRTVSLAGKPTLTVDTNTLKGFYHDKENFTINGTVQDSNAERLKICYKFSRQEDNNWVVGAERCSDYFSVKPGQPNKFSVSLPFTEIYPANHLWKITFYASDMDAYSDSYSHQFNYNVYSPPQLLKAGLSKKSAPANTKILCFAVLNDKQDDNIKVFVKRGTDKSFPERPEFSTPANPAPGEDYPVAFYWTVPSGSPIGAMDVDFKVVDSEGLDSNIITKTLVVTGN